MTFFGVHFRMCLWEMDASKFNSRFRVARTVEEEFALVNETRPSSTKNKHKWAVEIFREWQRTNIEISWFKRRKRFKDYDF